MFLCNWQGPIVIDLYFCTKEAYKLCLFPFRPIAQHILLFTLGILDSSLDSSEMWEERTSRRAKRGWVCYGHFSKKETREQKHVYMYMYVCVCTCVCVHKWRQIERQRQRESIERYRDRDSRTWEQKEIETHSKKEIAPFRYLDQIVLNDIATSDMVKFPSCAGVLGALLAAGNTTFVSQGPEP